MRTYDEVPVVNERSWCKVNSRDGIGEVERGRESRVATETTGTFG